MDTYIVKLWPIIIPIILGILLCRRSLVSKKNMECFMSVCKEIKNEASSVIRNIEFSYTNNQGTPLVDKMGNRPNNLIKYAQRKFDENTTFIIDRFMVIWGLKQIIKVYDEIKNIIPKKHGISVPKKIHNRLYSGLRKIKGY